MVYLIYAQDSHSLKIGYSKDVYKRLKTLNTGNISTLVVLKVLTKANRNVESQLHFKFRHYRVNKEWFSYQSIIIEEFDRLIPFFK